MNGIAVITVKSWNAGNADKHGKLPMLLKVVAGKVPNRSIISGTIAEREGFVENNSYLCQYTESAESETYGRQFNFSNLGQISGMEIIKATAELGEAVVVDVATNATPAATPVAEVKEEGEI